MTKADYGPAYAPLLALTKLFTLAAAATLIPWPSASWPNILGYSSLCTFAPGATFACGLLAGITCTPRARLVRRRPGPVFVPAFALGALVVGLAISTWAWAGVKASYAAPDAGSAATARE